MCKEWHGQLQFQLPRRVIIDCYSLTGNKQSLMYLADTNKGTIVLSLQKIDEFVKISFLDESSMRNTDSAKNVEEILVLAVMPYSGEECGNKAKQSSARKRKIQQLTNVSETDLESEENIPLILPSFKKLKHGILQANIRESHEGTTSSLNRKVADKQRHDISVLNEMQDHVTEDKGKNISEIDVLLEHDTGENREIDHHGNRDQEKVQDSVLGELHETVKSNRVDVNDTENVDVQNNHNNRERDITGAYKVDVTGYKMCLRSNKRNTKEADSSKVSGIFPKSVVQNEGIMSICNKNDKGKLKINSKSKYNHLTFIKSKKEACNKSCQNKLSVKKQKGSACINLGNKVIKRNNKGNVTNSVKNIFRVVDTQDGDNETINIDINKDNNDECVEDNLSVLNGILGERSESLGQLNCNMSVENDSLGTDDNSLDNTESSEIRASNTLVSTEKSPSKHFNSFCLDCDKSRMYDDEVNLALHIIGNHADSIWNKKLLEYLGFLQVGKDGTKCLECNSYYLKKSRHALRIHVDKHHRKHLTQLGSVLHKCSADRTLLSEEGTNCTKPGKVKCLSCGQFYSSMRSFKKHLERHHSKGEETELVRDAKRQWEDAKSNQWHLKGVKVTCPGCGFMFKAGQGIQLHIQLCHNYDIRLLNEVKIAERFGPFKQDGIPMCVCKYCSKTFPNSSVLEHLKTNHNDESSFTETLAMYRNRIIEFNSITKKINRNSVYDKVKNCPHCQKQTSTAAYGKHVKVCRKNPNRVKMYHCYCGYRSENQSAVEQHKAHCGKSVAMPLICEYCGVECKSRGALCYHRREKHGIGIQKPVCSFVCDVCRKSFSRKSSLLRHMTSHSDERNHFCKTCGKGFKSQAVLQQHHTTQHEKKYKFYCDNCGHGMEKLKYLESHVCGKVRRSKPTRVLDSSNSVPDFEMNCVSTHPTILMPAAPNVTLHPPNIRHTDLETVKDINVINTRSERVHNDVTVLNSPHLSDISMNCVCTESGDGKLSDQNYTYMDMS